MIPQRNLSLLSNELARKGGRRIPESVLERDYCLSWFLVGLSQCSLREILLFKGGTAIKKCHIADYRFSEDLDFSLINDKKYAFSTVNSEIERGLKLYGLDVETKFKKDRTVHSLLLKFPGLLKKVGLSRLESHPKRAGCAPG